MYSEFGCSSTICELQGHAASHAAETARLATQVSSLTEQLQKAQAAAAAAQQEAHLLKHKQQVNTSIDPSGHVAHAQMDPSAAKDMTGL